MSISIWIQCSRTDVFASELNFILRLYESNVLRRLPHSDKTKIADHRKMHSLFAHPFHVFTESRYTFGITTCLPLRIAGAAICLKKYSSVPTAKVICCCALSAPSSQSVQTETVNLITFWSHSHSQITLKTTWTIRHAKVTFLSHNPPLLTCMSCICQDVCCFSPFCYTKIDEQEAKTKHFAHYFVKLFPFKALWDSGAFMDALYSKYIYKLSQRKVRD